MKDAHSGKQHKTYPKFDGFIGNFFQINVDTTGIINCFHSVVRVHNLTQLQCSAGVVIFKISGDILNLCMRNYRRINIYGVSNRETAETITVYQT